ATLRTIVRLIITHRKLLEWQTASDTERTSSDRLSSYCRAMWIAPALAGILCAVVAIFRIESLPAAAPLMLLWMLAPFTAWWISQPAPEKHAELSGWQKRFLRITARKTWRYFETFVGSEDHWLPPDNFQEYPKPIIASRTSPTNIG